jgi:butyrate kinase
MGKKVFALNPGSTSTKIAVFDDTKCIYEKTLRHTTEEINKFETIFDQYQFRYDVIMEAFKESGIELSDLSAVVGRGGMFKPIPGGTYSVNDNMIDWVKRAPRGEHASNLGCVIAKSIADPLNIPSFIVDPVAVDEMADIAKVTGMPDYPRDSLFHALNQKAVAKRYAKEIGIAYDELNLIVAHLGGGVSVGMHEQGKVVDVNNALDGDGPMSPERSGTVPLGKLYKDIFAGKWTLDQIKKKNYGQGGLVAHLGTNNGLEVQKMIDAGDQNAEFIFEAFAYQVSKEIGGLATITGGKIDAILLTGGVAYNKLFTSWITDRVSFIAPVKVYGGEDELEALVEGALRVLNGEEEAQVY